MQNLKYPILLFDGVCNLCNNSVQWVLLHDKKAVFSFASLQSELGKQLLNARGLDPESLDTVVVLDQNTQFMRSDAALEVLWRLGSAWRLAYAFKVIPSFIRDAIYNWIARNRYRWFGRQETCMLPKPEWKARFLD